MAFNYWERLSIGRGEIKVGEKGTIRWWTKASLTQWKWAGRNRAGDGQEYYMLRLRGHKESTRLKWRTEWVTETPLLYGHARDRRKYCWLNMGLNRVVLLCGYFWPHIACDSSQLFGVLWFRAKAREYYKVPYDFHTTNSFIPQKIYWYQ